MSTVATPQIKKLAADWKLLWKSAILSGIVGDARHAAAGGYHLSRQDQKNQLNYSMVRPQDKAGNGPDDAASGIDMTLNAADMKACTARLVKAFENVADPRRKYVNAFNGTVDGKTARRWDVYARKVGTATTDHLWHVHLSIRRLYAASPTAMKAILSILKGETVEVYLKSIGVAPLAPKPVTPSKPAPKPVVPAYPGRILRRNDKQSKPDAALKLWQSRMLARGWISLGTADGFFGAKTEGLVKRWQKYAKLPVDGTIGPKTWPTPWTRPVAK
jgi:hypothetical protein